MLVIIVNGYQVSSAMLSIQIKAGFKPARFLLTRLDSRLIVRMRFPRSAVIALHQMAGTSNPYDLCSVNNFIIIYHIYYMVYNINHHIAGAVQRSIKNWFHSMGFLSGGNT